MEEFPVNDDHTEKEEKDLCKCNIDSIQRDTERLKLAKQISQQIDDELEKNINYHDHDDLALYTSETECGNVLDSTSNINRRAIFNDMGRLKSWRESIDKTNLDNSVGDVPSSSVAGDIIEEEKSSIIMEKNIDSVLGELPDVAVNKENISSTAVKKLSELETKISKQYSFKKD